MRSTALLFALLSLPSTAAAQLEIASDSVPPPPEARGFEPSFAVHSGLRIGYTDLSSSSSGFDAAVVGGPTFGVLFSYDAWRIFDLRVHLFQIGGAWGDERPADVAGDLGITVGTGLRGRIGAISLGVTALAGFSGWIMTPDTFTAELGGEASVTFHFGCEAAEIGYQAMASASEHGFADGASHRLIVRFVGSIDGPDNRACAQR